MSINKTKSTQLKTIAHDLRKMIINISYKSKAHHIGSALSCIDLLTTLYFYSMKINLNDFNSENRDWFMLSKGHAALALYVTLAKRGYFNELLVEKEFLKNGGIFGGHPDRLIKYGIEISSGSLGYGLSIAAGYALAAKKNNVKCRSIVLLGDGECNEGMIWEAVMFAKQHKLDNLVAIIDYNNLQGLGYCDEILDLSSLSEKFSSFGWCVREIDGHNITEIMNTLDLLPIENNIPNVIIANTIKGKGVSCLENRLDSHYKILNKQIYLEIIEELDSIVI